MGLVRVLLCILLLQGRLLLTLCLAHCSCYTFHDVTDKQWSKANDDCKTRNGTLVSMETEDEWNFITNEIQKINTTSNYDNEWFIGLRILRNELDMYSKLDNKRKANWTWISGKRLTIYNKWQPYEPNNYQGRGFSHYCVAMAKNWPKGKHGTIKDTLCDHRYPYICEYDAETRVSPSLNPVCWNNSSAKIRPQFNASSRADPVVVMTFLPVQVSNTERTTTETTTTVSVRSKTPVSTMQSTFNCKCQKEEALSPKYYIIVIALLAVLLLTVTAILIAVCCRMRKMNGKFSLDRSQIEAQSNNAHVMDNLNQSSQAINIQGPETVAYAEINDDPSSAYDDVRVDITSPPPTGLYASLDESSRQQHSYHKLKH